MEESYYVGVYWLTRRETAVECARRSETFFRLLAACDPSFAHWFETGWTLEEALKQRFVPDEERFLRDFSQQEANEGFSLRVWNGKIHEAPSSVSLHCGEASVWVSNCCVVSLPNGGATAERLLQVPALTQILRAMVLAWEPEWGVAASNSLRNMQTESGEAGTFVGWVTYFSHRRGQVPVLASSRPCRIRGGEGFARHPHARASLHRSCGTGPYGGRFSRPGWPARSSTTLGTAELTWLCQADMVTRHVTGTPASPVAGGSCSTPAVAEWNRTGTGAARCASSGSTVGSCGRHGLELG